MSSVTDFLISRLDYIFLVYGLAFFLIAFTAGAMARRRTKGEYWAFLCAFGLAHGISAWAEMVFPLLEASHWVSALRGAILGVSFLCLAEFGRWNILWGRKWRPGVWIYLPGLIVILLGVLQEPGDFHVLIRYCFGLPAGILASFALWQTGMEQRDRGKRWPLALAPLALFLYTVGISLIGPNVFAGTANVLNDQWFLNAFGIPVQAIRCVLACFFAWALWIDYTQWHSLHYPADYIRRIRLVRWVSAPAIAFALVAGWMLVERADEECQSAHARRLSGLSRVMAAMLHPKLILSMQGSVEDVNSAAHQHLQKVCQEISEVDPDIRYVYIVTSRGGKMVFLVDIEPFRYMAKIDRPNALPGEVYQAAPPELVRAYQSGATIVSKPYQDDWGNFVSSFSPVVDAAGNVIAVLGIDEQAAKWLGDVAYARLSRLMLTGGALLLLLIFALLWRHEIEESRIRNSHGRRIQVQQSALLGISNSTFLAEGNIFMMARAVTASMAEVIGVDRVDLWLRVKDQHKFRAEDIYQSAKEGHASGAYSCVSPNDPYLGLLDEGRVILSSDVQSDERFTGIRGDIGADACSVMAAPVRLSGRLEGWLMAVQSLSRRHWLADEMRFVAEMADQCSSALSNNERTLAEEALRKAHAELEMRVQERTEALSVKNDELVREINERLRMEDEQRKLQDKMLQTQKLESLGLMAGGIAHDFNNILMAVLGNVELARLETPPDSPIYEYLQDIDKASSRAAELARQMLIYSGRGHACIQGVNLNDMVMDMTSMLKVSLGRKVHLVFELDTRGAFVEGDLTQLRQILMNLVINASEAIANQEGTITLRTGVRRYDKSMFSTMWLKEELPEGNYCFLDVIDDGCGMDEATVKRIFDPFFTTKFTGRGLGLAAVLGIIKGHHGAIDVISLPGKGTHFRVILPEGGHRGKGHEGAKAGGVQSGAIGEGTILLAEDEAEVRILGRKMLERIGFNVLDAKDGREAIEIFRKHQGHIRCVLLDMTMPDLDGKLTLDGILEIDPTAKVIMCSGYSVADVAGNVSNWKVAGFLQKPYQFETLMNLLRETLGAA